MAGHENRKPPAAGGPSRAGISKHVPVHYADIAACVEDFRAFIQASHGLELVGALKPDGEFHGLATTAFGTRVTVAEMRERWGHSNNKYLDELARLGELIPWHGREGIAIYTRPKGLGCQFGIPPDIQWSDKGSVVFDAGEMVWMDTLPDDAYYGLPFILEYEEKNPYLKQKAEGGGFN